jgi:hypothetical protein
MKKVASLNRSIIERSKTKELGSNLHSSQFDEIPFRLQQNEDAQISDQIKNSKKFGGGKNKTDKKKNQPLSPCENECKFMQQPNEIYGNAIKEKELRIIANLRVCGG